MQLKAGQLDTAYRRSQQQEPIVRLQISADLTELPKEVFDLADSLEILDLSNNQLTDLPDELATLVNLRILFLSNNHFELIPGVLARCPNLEMISFKSNRLTRVCENVLPIDTRWLILTDNRIETLPNSMGQLHRLQKLALAGNRLTKLPDSMQDCENLELARLSANDFSAMPDWLFHLPKLAWLAFSGNRLHDSASANAETADVNPSMIDVALVDIQLSELLGEGASGHIYRGDWLNQPASLVGTDNHIAVKIFKGDVTSDGYPQDELACCLSAGEQQNLIKVIAKLDQTDAENKLGLVMELIPASFYNLGLPPSLITCTRDTFKQGTSFSIKTIAKIALQMANAMAHLHKNNISHGDVYAHNTMINDKADVLFGDFGAATDLSLLPSLQKAAMERIEVRAFGCLLDDLLQLAEESPYGQADEVKRISALKDQCMHEDNGKRPSFTQLQQLLKDISQVLALEATDTACLA